MTEKDIRDWLQGKGYESKTARITGLDLHAIERPGWVQVFRFEVKLQRTDLTTVDDLTVAENLSESQQHYGVVLDDERIRNVHQRTQVWLFESQQRQKAKLDELSNGRITSTTGQNGQLIWLVGIVLVTLIAAGIVSNLT